MSHTSRDVIFDELGSYYTLITTTHDTFTYVVGNEVQGHAQVGDASSSRSGVTSIETIGQWSRRLITTDSSMIINVRSITYITVAN